MMPPERLFDWLDHRGAGVLLHPTSLPGDQGVGTLGQEAHRFLDFLQAGGFSYWQLCPLGPTGYGDSPYQCFSAFAGNPYLIDLREVVERGYLTPQEVEPLRRLSTERVDFGGLWCIKWKLLEVAHQRYAAAGAPDWGEVSYEDFRTQEASWLESYALFMALKQHHGGRPWMEWPEGHRSFAAASRRAELRKELEHVVDAYRFHQYLFFAQWQAMREEAAVRGVEIIGDIPIFVAADSADVWAHPELFDLEPQSGRLRHVAGVPPDYFSADGQLWGNPLYAWRTHEEGLFQWWRARIGASFRLYDVLRIDHFRGFDEYWEVPAPAVNARGGQWRAGPGLRLFAAIKEKFPEAKIIAEDLGLLTPGVTALRERTGLPGMAVLQFAFGGKPDNLYLPHNVTANCVIYAGTHDNDTTRGWYQSAGDHIRDHVRRYLRVDGRDVAWDFIRAAYESVCRLAIVTMPDLMNLGSEGRLNTPGQPAGNWGWRYRADQLDRLFGDTAKYLKQLADLYGRLPPADKDEETES